MQTSEYREIPFNYTSASGAQIVTFVFGPETWSVLEQLREWRQQTPGTDRDAYVDRHIHDGPIWRCRMLRSSPSRWSETRGRPDALDIFAA